MSWWWNFKAVCKELLHKDLAWLVLWNPEEPRDHLLQEDSMHWGICKDTLEQVLHASGRGRRSALRTLYSYLPSEKLFLFPHIVYVNSVLQYVNSIITDSNSFKRDNWTSKIGKNICSKHLVKCVLPKEPFYKAKRKMCRRMMKTNGREHKWKYRDGILIVICFV